MGKAPGLERWAAAHRSSGSLVRRWVRFRNVCSLASSGGRWPTGTSLSTCITGGRSWT
jgi:hypothetical protein